MLGYPGGVGAAGLSKAPGKPALQQHSKAVKGKGGNTDA